MNVGMLTLLPLVAGGPTGPVPVPGAAPAMTARPGAPVAVPYPGPAMMTAPHPGMGLPAPVLPARIMAPRGVRVTAYPGTPLARMFDTPITLAFRPGYSYRLELSGLPNHPGRVLYPEITVHGS